MVHIRCGFETAGAGGGGTAIDIYPLSARYTFGAHMDS